MKKFITSILLLLTCVSVFAQLFQKHNGNPVFNVLSGQPTWRSLHVANVTILAPNETPDGKWRMFLRGSGNNPDGYHDNIGMFDQPASSFNPLGTWNEYGSNPNLPHGSSYDAMHVLDAAATPGQNGNIYLYYMARDNNNTSSLCGAVSSDGGFNFSKFSTNPMKLHVGANEAVYHNGQYYIYYGDAKWNGNGFNEKLQIHMSVSNQPDQLNSNTTYAIRVGGSGDFDSESVNGAKIFKVSGDNRWFMIYQTSGVHFDYPDRFHAAYSDDLINWTKVNNSTPLLTRGNIGQWDQGAIWTGAVIEHGGRLYIYYEGWGSFNHDSNRNDVYYPQGNSRVGIASVSTGDFLNWVNGSGGGVTSINAGSVYRIVNRHSNKTLEIAGESTANEADVTQWDYWGGGNQHFKMEDAGSGYYRMTPMHNTSKCVEVYGWSTQNEAKVVQWDYAAGANQQWSITNVGGEYFSIVNRHSNKGLDVWSWSQDNGGKIVQWDYLGGNNQQWKFISVANAQGRQGGDSKVETTSSQISLYPNPAGRTIHVDLGTYEGLAEISLLSINGQEIRREETKQSSIDINLDKVALGMFIVKVKINGKTETHKVVVSK